MAVPKEYFTQLRPEMLAFIPKNAKHVLDIGCGAGVFSAQLKQRGVEEIWGVELDEQAAREAKKQFHTVLVGMIEEQMHNIPDGYFDVIICNDILEHLVDPRAVLDSLKTKLSKSGVIVSSLPNVRYFLNLWHVLVQKDWKYEDYGILDRTHLRFFTKKSISRMWTELGFEPLELEGINPITSWKFTLINALTLGQLSDTRYMQFASVVKPKE